MDQCPDYIIEWRSVDMNPPDALLDPDDEALPEGDECTGNPSTCPCEACQSWRIDMEADQ